MLDPAAMARVRSSYDILTGHDRSLVDAFYESLFATAPGSRSLFPADLSTHRGFVLAALGLVVKHVDDPTRLPGEALMQVIEGHLRQGDSADLVGAVRDSMLGAIAKTFFPLWTPVLHADWTGALYAASDVMLKGAARQQPVRAAA